MSPPPDPVRHAWQVLHGQHDRLQAQLRALISLTPRASPVHAEAVALWGAGIVPYTPERLTLEAAQADYEARQLRVADLVTEALLT